MRSPSELHFFDRSVTGPSAREYRGVGAPDYKCSYNRSPHAPPKHPSGLPGQQNVTLPDLANTAQTSRLAGILHAQPYLGRIRRARTPPSLRTGPQWPTPSPPLSPPGRSNLTLSTSHLHCRRTPFLSTPSPLPSSMAVNGSGESDDIDRGGRTMRSSRSALPPLLADGERRELLLDGVSGGPCVAPVWPVAARHSPCLPRHP